MVKKKVTIQDIADRVGVSKTTVSKYLNGQYQYMSASTAERISAAIKELDFRPSLTARSLKSSKSHLIGVVMPHVWSDAIAHSIQIICSECEKNNYFAIICSSDDSVEQEAECINRLIDQKVDGILCYTGGMNRQYKEVNVPVVITNRYLEDCDFDMVIINSYDVVKRAVDALMEQGYERIAYITTNVTPLSAKITREKAFYDYVQQHGLPVEHFPRYCVENGSIPEFSEILHEFCEQNRGKRLAVFAASNSILLRVKAALDIYGERLPHDIGFCGYEFNNENPSIFIPGTLVIQHPLNQMAKQAIHLLLMRINGDTSDMPTTIRIEPRLTQIAR